MSLVRRAVPCCNFKVYISESNSIHHFFSGSLEFHQRFQSRRRNIHTLPFPRHIIQFMRTDIMIPFARFIQKRQRI
ncbi:Uncharacterised protein [Segatella copri]|nr:Uncharacterised protein [Segatella copri]